MPPPQRPSVSASSTTKATENLWLWLFIIAIVAVVVALGTARFVTQREQATNEQLREQERAFEIYRANTRPSAPPPPQASAQMQEARRVRETLLQHPAVTPGVGFDAPGVQATGIAIVEALDRSRP